MPVWKRSLKQLKKLVGFLSPAPLDAWTITSLLFWMLAVMESVIWFAAVPGVDPIEMPKPMLYGSIALFLGLIAACLFGSPRPALISLFLGTVAVAWLLFLVAGQWLRVSKMVGVYAMDEVFEGKQATIAELSATYRWHLAAWIGLAILAAALSLWSSRLGWIVNANQFIVTQTSRLGSLVNKYRTRLMIGFAVIMFPATILRNAVDTELRSHSYVVGAFAIVILVVTGIIALHVASRCVFNRKWLFLKAPLLLAVAAGISWYWLTGSMGIPPNIDYVERSSANVAWALTPLFFTFAFLSALIVGPPKEQVDESKGPTRRRLVSLWPLIIALPAIGSAVFLLNRYDPLVFAKAALESDSPNAKPSMAELIAAARESRRIESLTGGAARVVAYYSSFIHYVKIRDERDAGCLDALIASQPPGIKSIMIENIQPFVDTEPLRRYSEHVGVVGGVLTEQHLADICGKASSLAIGNTKLPSQNERGVTLPPTFMMFGESLDNGFPDFVDAYLVGRRSKVYLDVELSMEDWGAVIRANQVCPFEITNWTDLPIGASTSPEIAKQPSLSGISLSYVYLMDREGDIAKLLETDINFQRVFVDDDQMSWDLVFTNPRITRGQLQSSGKTLPFRRAAKDYHWAYGWNDQEQITHLWVPTINEVESNAADMNAVRTLRFDRRGYLGFRSYQALDLSPLGKLPQLERLYLDSGEYFGDLKFLAKLPKLVHLQIQAQTRDKMKGSGFEVCKNLESIRFFGTPPAISIEELAGLTKLKRLEIVDDELTFQDEGKVAELKEQLPKVEIKIIPPDAFEPDLSDRLKNHLKSVRDSVVD